VDFVVKERLFNFFLNLGCVPFTDDHKLMEKIATTNAWSRPITVYGYDDTMSFAGDLFEAETNCVKEHNMGQVASNGCSNLAYYSRNGHLKIPMVQVKDPGSIDLPYNKSKTYITFVMGDGDNLNFVKGSRKDWMNERVELCLNSSKECYPLAWTLSPAALRVAPDWIKWYYEQSEKTKADYFVLPPSGDTYSYPGEMQDADQDSFVAATEYDAKMMNLSHTVSWEFFSTWPKAIKNFFPKYAKNGVIKSVYAVNVPYLFPVFAWGKEEYLMLGEGDSKVALFRPNEWRGWCGKSKCQSNTLKASDLASKINGMGGGTVTHIYTTSDGGFNLSQLSDLVAALDEHVSIVSPNELALRAHQRG
jgi:hypothetical protein